MPTITQFINCRLCISGHLIPAPLTVSPTGHILSLSPTFTRPTNHTLQTIDLHNAILAPGFIELQINGALGFHFAHYSDAQTYTAGVTKLANYLPSTGVTGFYPTIPTVSKEVFRKALPCLVPRDIEGGATVLGAHVEGPFIAPSKKGAHDASLMHIPSSTTLEEIYGLENLENSIKIVTLAPELPGALEIIKKLEETYRVRVSMGHSAATFEEGKEGVRAGAGLITHLCNAMNGVHHREPGLIGLISLPSNPPHFTLIADSIHIHPSLISLFHSSSPSTCILITDSIELSGLPNGTHPGHAQIPHNQVKKGNRVTIEGTDTLVGACIGLDECVRNVMKWSGKGVEGVVGSVTENVVRCMERLGEGEMGERGEKVGMWNRGRLEVGRRADLVLLSDDGIVLETWVLGKKVFDRKESLSSSIERQV